MAVGEHTSVEPGLIPALARHLQHLKDQPDGGDLFQLIQDSLLYCRQHDYVNASCIAYLHAKLLAYTKDHTQPSPVRIRARLIQQYLALYLPRSDHAAPANGETRAEPKQPQTKPAREAASHSAEGRSEVLPKQQRSQPKTAGDSTVISARKNEDTLEQKPQVVKAAETPSLNQGTAQNLDEIDPIKANRLDELLREREALSLKLTEANACLKMIEAEREQLRSELNVVRKRARTNEKSLKKLGLPKRDVLMRQIQSEVERVKRHGNPLALALIDVDDLEKIDGQHGHDVTKAVLDHYTSEILGNFRSYDLVARYNKDEFAVLLPNTDKNDATRALEKIRKRASESHFNHKGKSYPLPGFGGVLTFYTPGEEPQQMLRRADEALVNLKLRGHHEVVIV